MTRTTVILGHPSHIRKPEDLERLEEQTGRKAIIARTGVRLVLAEDACEMVDRQAYLGQIGDFPLEAA